MRKRRRSDAFSMLLFALFSLAFHKVQYSFLTLGDFEWRIQALPYASIFSFGTAAYLDSTSIRARRISATVFSLSYRFFDIIYRLIYFMRTSCITNRNFYGKKLQ